jgi:hypothetical protein
VEQPFGKTAKEVIRIIRALQPEAGGPAHPPGAAIACRLAVRRPSGCPHPAAAD